MKTSKKYIILTKMGYYSGINHKYSELINISDKKYAYTFDSKETAYDKAEYLQRMYFDVVKIQEVLANYAGEWEEKYFIVGEHYSDCELEIKNCMTENPCYHCYAGASGQCYITNCKYQFENWAKDVESEYVQIKKAS